MPLLGVIIFQSRVNCSSDFILSDSDSCIMPRTKGDGGAARTVASKAPRKALGGGGASAAASRAISAAGAAASPGQGDSLLISVEAGK